MALNTLVDYFYAIRKSEGLKGLMGLGSMSVVNCRCLHYINTKV